MSRSGNDPATPSTLGADLGSDRLYDLLPVVHRMRDHDQGEPLKALLEVIAEQVEVVEADIRQLYENWFIETCEEWVVPYLADLIGYSPVHASGPAGDVGTPEGRLRNRVLAPRREVANTLRYRRRKGTLALLEDLARDLAGWPARAVELYQLLAWSQSLNQLRSARGRSANLREGDALDRLGGPFEAIAHTVDLRRIGSRRTRGLFQAPNVAVFLWRLRAYPVTGAPAYCLEEEGPFCYTVSVLGNHSPLFTRPVEEPSPDHIAGPLNVPVPISRRAFEQRRSSAHQVGAQRLRTQVSDDYYGFDPDGNLRSLVIWAPGWPVPNPDPRAPVPAERIIPADLSTGQYSAPKGYLLVDPLLGRIAFPPSQLPRKGVFVSYHYGFSADMGGGEYRRTVAQPKGARIYRVVRGPLGPDAAQAGTFDRLADALKRAREDAASAANAHPRLPFHAVIEIDDDGLVISEQLPRIVIAPGNSLQIRAAGGRRAVIRLLDAYPELPDSMSFELGPGSRLTLDGLMITGRAVHIEALESVQQPASPAQQPDLPAMPKAAALEAERPAEHPPAGSSPDTGLEQPLPCSPSAARVRIRHCTLVPGWALGSDCEPKRPAEPSLEIYGVDENGGEFKNIELGIEIAHSILGSIQVQRNQVKTEPVAITLRDSILDATGSTCSGPECEALGAPGSAYAHAALRLRNTTVFGHVFAHAIDLAENSIFEGQVRVARRQRGCMRFCYVRPGSRTPRRFHCQPDLVEQPIRTELRRQGEREPAAIDRALEPVRTRVQPQFESSRYGTPSYGRLALACAEELRRGAEDGSEMGAFHSLYEAQRADNLRVRLDDFTPAGMDVGIIFAS